ncbi:MAG: efflux RND transporter periplasmic adaptor subunit [Prevotella sp.]|nr:efflux RND transporter periplasmic adaptor subunit [Prevotella sp.]
MKLKNYIMFAVMLAVGMSFMSCGSKKDKTSQVKYETRIVKADTLTYNVFIPAALHGVHEVEVYPQVEGIIRKVNFTDGVKVSQGQVLFVIDQTEAKLQVQNAQANLAAARAQMETTKLRYESNKQLASKKIVSQYVMSTSLNAYHVAQAAVEQAQAQLSIAKTNLSYCTVTSPITGMIKENGFKIGEIADMSKMLCTVSDNSYIQAWFSYTESQLLELMEQYNLKATADGLRDVEGKPIGEKLPKLKLQLKNGQTYKYEGVVTEIGGIVDGKTGTVICKATFPNPDDELRSGLSATLIFPTKIKKAFRIPRTAAVRLQNQLMFYRVKKDGTAEGVICDAIPSNSGNNYYVKNGLRDGDEVVIRGAHKLSNGDKVR